MMDKYCLRQLFLCEILNAEDAMKDGDIYRWRYNKETLKRLNDGNNGSTTYWAMSNIGIWNETAGKLYDTFWSGDRKWFSAENIKQQLELTFVANINDLEAVPGKYAFNNYDKSDCVDISHSNMSKSGFYIKKGAKPSIEKKRRVIQAHIKHHEYKAKSHADDAARLKKDLENLTADSFVPWNPDVFIE